MTKETEMHMNEQNASVELVFKKLIIDLIEELQMTHAEFGRRAFGEKDGQRLWQTIKLPNKNRKQRKISLSDALNMAAAVNGDFAYLIWQAHQIIKYKTH